MFKFAIAAVAATPFLASAAFAGPYVESKTTTALSDGTYKGAQTELRVGYDAAVGNGVTLFGEIGPGYEWTKGATTTTGQAVAVGEVGVTVPVAKQVAIKAKVAGEYGNTTKDFDLGGELKVRYSF